MPVTILEDSYGKSRVRLLKVDKSSPPHELQNLTVNIALEGNFDAIHKDGNNTRCLPTDTMKNTVYALAGQTAELEPIEKFGIRLANHFLTSVEHVNRVRIDISQHAWERMTFGRQGQDHSFVSGSPELRTAKINAARDNIVLEGGVEDLVVLKSSKSGFAGFIKDAYTTLPEVTDRILATSIKSTWRYGSPEDGTDEVWNGIRRSILETFADHDSLSVQHTLYAMGEAVLEKFALVAEISFSMPNIHCLPVDITKFGLEDRNCIFVPTDEPHGLIEAKLSR